MKKVRIINITVLLSLLAIAVFPLAFPQIALANGMSGSGTALDPYIITTVTHLQNMDSKPEAYYELGGNIDATITSTWNGGIGFAPIGGTNTANRAYVGGADNYYSVALPTQRQSVYANDYYWSLYKDLTTLHIASSPDGQNWTDQGSIGQAYETHSYSITYNDWLDKAYVVYIDISSDMYFKVLTLFGNGTVALGGAVIAVEAPFSGTFRHPSISVSDDNIVYIGYTRNWSGDHQWTYITKMYDDGGWTTPSGFPYQLGSYEGGDDIDIQANVGVSSRSFYNTLVVYSAGTDLYSICGNDTGSGGNYTEDWSTPILVSSTLYWPSNFSLSQDGVGGFHMVRLENSGDAIYEEYMSSIDGWYYETTLVSGLNRDECPVLCFDSLARWYIVGYHSDEEEVGNTEIGYLYYLRWTSSSGLSTLTILDTDVESYTSSHNILGYAGAVNCFERPKDSKEVGINTHADSGDYSTFSLLAGFRGNFNGNGYSITNLYIDRPEESNVGLFGSIGYNAEVGNFTLVNPVVIGNTTGTVVGLIQHSSIYLHDIAITNGDITSNYYAGGIIGYVLPVSGTYPIYLYNLSYEGVINSSTCGGIAAFAEAYSASIDIAGCSFNGALNGDSYVGGIVGELGAGGNITYSYSEGVIYATEYAGGIAGLQVGTNIANCASTMDIDASGSYCGGLVGYSSYGTITQSYAIGSVTCYSEGGGLVGHMVASDSIHESFAMGDVSVSDGYAGGLVGIIITNNIENCYAMGNVYSVDRTNGVGGLVGYSISSDITNSYSMGNVTWDIGAAGDGGLVGKRTGGGVYVSFWDTETSGQSTSNGGTGHDTTWMTNGLYFDVAGWDDSIWCQLDGFNSDYPYLQNVTPSAPVPCDLSGLLPTPTPPFGTDCITACNMTVCNLLAIPVTNTDIKLTWDWWPVSGNSSTQIAIYYGLYYYPIDLADGTLIYQGTGDAYTHTNLSPGTTYYYRAWLLCGGNYSADYVQDWATTYGSPPVVSPPEQPEGWFQDPSCTAYSKIPLLSDALVAVTTAYGFPATTVCVMFTLLWIIVLGLAVFLFIHSAMMMIITIAVLIILASIMGLLPLWMIVIAICLGGISIYISGRT